jgi:hypothetical protein
MHGPAQRLIRQRGSEYTIRNASGGSGGRDTPSYSDDGTLTAVLERLRGTTTVTNSGGTEIETDLKLRAVTGSGTTIREAGDADGYPTKLDHPDGLTYRIMERHPEDSGVTVLLVVRD